MLFLIFIFAQNGKISLDLLALSFLQTSRNINYMSIELGKFNTLKVVKEVDFGTAEWLILPGGMPGSKNLGGCARLVDALKVHAAAEKPLAAICAAPFVLGVNGMLENRAATCFPGFEGMLHGAEVSGRMVEIDRNIVTGKGPAAATDFASAIIGMAKGKEAIKEVRLGMLVDSE